MEPTTLRTVAAPVVVSLEEKRSVFECWLRPVGDETAARAVVEEARSTHWDARHHCSAFVLGPGGSTVRSNDDGEPGGTAGMPMLEALTGAGLTDVVAVVTRWFGGTLLGTGGLVRAYGGAVREAVGQAAILVRQQLQLLQVATTPDLTGRLEHDLRAQDVQILDVLWGAGDVVLLVGVPAERVDQVRGEVARLTSGAGLVDEVGTRWVDLPPGSSG
ncbi:IMPACT family protein [Ornithinimicrobium pratense]|uniref:YigZ family protein n=1 Tax=Ornithinimicrobium pratense TaxID=2593973 RepID=A0A5J6V8X0_9MICO|nr:YigZ family protein [Ornithinimicrobium pratense]QFG69626.1 YigZ family protein [Ornithinimicrobium pratense]